MALIGGVCHILPQSTAWRFVGFARILEVIADIPNLSAQSHITEPIDGAFELSVALNLEIPGEAIDGYKRGVESQYSIGQTEHLRVQRTQFLGTV